MAGSRAAPPVPTPKPTPAPSALANGLARSLQRELKAAHLSDELTAKIAGDIQSNFDIAKAFRKVRLRNADEPDTVFFAGRDEQ